MKDMEEEEGGREGEEEKNARVLWPRHRVLEGSQANWAPGEEQHKHRVLVRAGVIYRGHRAPCPPSSGSEDDPYLPAIDAALCAIARLSSESAFHDKSRAPRTI